MKFHVDSYHFKLLRDYERLAVFKEAIEEFSVNNLSSDLGNASQLNGSNSSLAYDLGCGSGVLSYFSSFYFDKVMSIEMSPSSFRLSKENLKDLDNVEVFNENVLDFDFANHEKADLIVCEMLDTALIDEEEVPILNHAKKYLKENGRIIPQGIINQVEPILMDIDYIQYEDDEYQPKYEVLGKPIIFSEFDFLDDIDESFSAVIEFEIGKGYKEINDIIEVNGMKLTSFTKLSENIICGPTPMLNPPMLIPFERINVRKGDRIRVKLSYIMGGGVETIKTELID